MVDLSEFEFETLGADCQEEDTDDVDKNPFIKRGQFATEEIEMNESEEDEKETKFNVGEFSKISTLVTNSETTTNVKKEYKVRNVIPKMSPEDEQVMNSMVKVDTDGTYLCNTATCKYKCKSRTVLVRHIKVMHLNLVSYSCTQCSYATKFSQSLTAHVLGVHEKVKQFCKLCDYTSTHKATIYHHMRKAHGNDDKTKCPECDYKSSSKDVLECHINGKHLKNPLFCEKCGFQTTWRNCLRNHMRTKHEKSNKHSKCDLCDFTSVFPYGMKTHVYFTHQAGSGMVIRKTKVGHYLCDQCEYKALKSANLKQHFVSKHVHPSFFE